MRGRFVLGGVVAALTAALLLPGTAAQAKGPEIGGAGSTYYLNDNWTGAANISFSYGRPDDRVYVGDWNADGRDTLAVRRGATYYLTNAQKGGAASTTFTYGRPDDTTLIGDWNGDGTDTLAVRRGNTYYLTNALRGGAAETVFTYGRPTDQVLVGDWNGDGRDTLAVRRGNTFYFTDTLRGGTADTTVAYGRRDDQVYTGDWNGDGIDTPVVRRGSTYYVTDTFDGGAADRTLTYGRPTDHTLIGDWNADTRDTLGVRRPPAVKNPTQQWADRTFGTFTPTTITGTSDDVVDLPAGAQAGIITASYGTPDLSSFGLDLISPDGGYADLLLSFFGGSTYHGTVAFGSAERAQAGSQIVVRAGGDWTITVAPYSSAPELPPYGAGDGVYLYSRAASTARVTFTASGPHNNLFEVDQFERPNSPDLDMSFGGTRYSEDLRIAGGPSTVAIRATGTWTFDFD